MAENNSPPGHGDIEAVEAHLTALAPKMQEALRLRGAGEVRAAHRLLEQIVSEEPRLAEPRLELAHLAVEARRWSEAQEQARMAVDLLRAGGQWIEDLQPKQLLAFALNLLGETIVRALEDGEAVIEDQAAFQGHWNEAVALFIEARSLDGQNQDALRNATRYRAIG